MAMNLEHPDLHWYFPLAKPKGVRPAKLAEAMEKARYDTIAERKERPLRPASAATEPTGLYLAVAQTLRSHAHRRPAVGLRQVFVIGDAETLVPQESSQEAANALLKLLEEPPTSTLIILTSSEPGRLLPTIRSRTMPLHLPPLAPDAVNNRSRLWRCVPSCFSASLRAAGFSARRIKWMGWIKTSSDQSSKIRQSPLSEAPLG